MWMASSTKIVAPRVNEYISGADFLKSCHRMNTQTEVISRATMK